MFDRNGSSSPPAAVLVQLPLPDAQGFTTGSNVPVAAGYLKAHAAVHGACSTEGIRILPRTAVDHGGDAAVLDRIESSGAGITGFTCYLWNVERSLFLAEQLKDRSPGMRIVLGGPELDRNHPAGRNPAVDTIVLGEGEAAFTGLLESASRGETWERRLIPAGSPPLSAIPNPYLTGALPLHRGETVFFESMRGCPHRCSFCSYSKNSPRVRFFPESRLREIFKRGEAAGSGEIYLMDPSFHAGPDLNLRLHRIAGWNRSRIPIHTELRLESVDSETALNLRAAGVRSVEAGLQSVNARALAAVHRTWDRKAFTRGARLLKDQGIHIRTGVIIGLPHDTPDTIRKTVDFVIDLGLADQMEFYPLSVLPGTRLRGEAESLGLSYMPKPPYWVTGHPALTERDIQELIFWIEDSLDIDFFPAFAPARGNAGDFTRFADMRRRPAAVFRELTSAPGDLGNRLTLLIHPSTPFELLSGLAAHLRKATPHTLVQIIIDSIPRPPQELTSGLRAAFFSGPHYFDRIHHFMKDPQRTFSLRLYHLTSDLDTARRAAARPGPCDLILRYRPGGLDTAADLLEDHPILWIEPGVETSELDELRRRYRCFPHLLLPPPESAAGSE